MTKILIINPRAMHFDELRATSIDLCVRDIVRFSRFKDTTTVIGDPVDAPFPDVRFLARPVGRNDTFHTRAPALLAMVKKMAPDVICVQEHLRTAVYLSKRLPVPVLLQKHNPLAEPRNIVEAFLGTRRYNRLAGVIFVSSVLRRDFETAWPNVKAPRYVVFNGLDMTAWRPAQSRERTVLVVGRATPEKGIREAADALANLLPHYSDWKALFILNEAEANPDYIAGVRTALKAITPQAALQVQQPFACVKEQMEKAAIVIVPSKWKEPFGRTALEAHAGGAALVSSGRGGLAELSGDTAVFLRAVTSKDIAEAVGLLIKEPERRAALAAAGRERVARLFDVRAVAASCDEVYIEALKNYRVR